MDDFNKTVYKDRQVQVWGVVDGVGYSENKEGTINKMLHSFHAFIQMKSLWKAAIELHKSGLCEVKAIRFNMNFYSEKTVRQMSSKYLPSDIQVLSPDMDIDSSWQSFNAGQAMIFHETS